MKEYEKLKAEDDALAAEIKRLETALDRHTKDNREKRKALQDQRTGLSRGMQALSQQIAQGQEVMQDTSTPRSRAASRWRSTPPSGSGTNLKSNR
jgi:predicted  nucleic acid-binding Zn-ribbon protein